MRQPREDKALKFTSAIFLNRLVHAHSYRGLLRMSQFDSFYNLLIRRQKHPTRWPISREFFLAHHGVPPGYHPAPNLSNTYIQASLGCAYAIIDLFLEQRGYEHKYKARKWKHNLRIYMVIVVQCRRNILWTWRSWSRPRFMVMGDLQYAPLFHLDFNQSLLLAGLPLSAALVFQQNFFLLFTHFQDLVQIGPQEGVWKRIRGASRRLNNSSLRQT